MINQKRKNKSKNPLSKRKNLSINSLRNFVNSKATMMMILTGKKRKSVHKSRSRLKGRSPQQKNKKSKNVIIDSKSKE